MNYFLIQKILFPLAEFISHTQIQVRLKFLMKSQYWSKEKISKYQDEKLLILLKHSYQTVPYYRNLFDKLKLTEDDFKSKECLSKIPFLTKEIIKKNEQEIRSTKKIPFSFDKFTSGSTAQPMRFTHTKFDYSWQWGGHFRSWSWAGFSLGDSFLKISLNNDRDKLTKRIQDTIMQCTYIYSKKFDSTSIKEYVNVIMKKKPLIIYGYSSQLNLLAEYMNQNNIIYQAKSVISTGDNLPLSFRKNIEKAFNAKNFDGYGCGGEGLNIAAQCEVGNYHINDDLVIIEIINNKIYITNLFNFAMPLIRYEVGDIGSLSSKKCSCGRNLSILNSIDGRSTDVIKTKNGDSLVVHYFNTFFEYYPDISRYQIIQKDIKSIEIQIISPQGFNKKYFEDNFKNYLWSTIAINSLKLTFNYVDIIPLESNGKMKLIKGLK